MGAAAEGQGEEGLVGLPCDGMAMQGAKGEGGRLAYEHDLKLSFL